MRLILDAEHADELVAQPFYAEPRLHVQSGYALAGSCFFSRSERAVPYSALMKARNRSVGYLSIAPRLKSSAAWDMRKFAF